MTDIAPAPATEGTDSPQGEGSEITVCIEFNPVTGEYSVGIEPPEGAEAGGEAEGAGDTDATAGAGAGVPGGEADEEANEQSWMKPAKDINDALRQAKQLLEQPTSASGGPSPFEQGFAGARGTPIAGTPGGGPLGA
jgi:hypothetical protein